MAASDILQDLSQFTVQIIDLRTDAAVGTGFAVSMDGKVVTCAHVVKAAGLDPKSAEGKTIGVYFPQVDSEDQKKHQAIILAYFAEAEDDVVLLQLVEKTSPLAPEQIAVLGVAEGSDTHPFRAYGFRILGQFISGWADGKILGSVEVSKERHYKVKPIQLKSEHIDLGMSGAPVLDTDRNLVVGIVSETWFPDSNNPKDRDTAWAVNARVLSLEPIRLYLADQVYKMETGHKLRVASQPFLNMRPSQQFRWNNAPKTLKEWVGRDDLLSELDRIWIEDKVRIFGAVGFGGEGKSSLIRHWLDEIINNKALVQPEAIYWWGFYENRNIEEFFEDLLDFLGGGKVNVREHASLKEKLQIAIRLLEQGRYIIVLDGIEVLQYQIGDRYGLIQNTNLREFLAFFAETQHDSLCVITSRVPLRDMLGYKTYAHLDIDRLNLKDGRRLLRKLEINGNDSALNKVIIDWDGHALTLSLMAAYLSERYKGDISKISEIPSPDSNETRYESVHRMLIRYDTFLSDKEKAFLTLFSAFRLPVSEDALNTVFRIHLDENAIFAPLNSIDDAQMSSILGKLLERRIIRHNLESEIYTIHPLVRDHYYARLKSFDRADVQGVYRRLKSFYLKIFGTLPEHPTLSELSPLMEAIYHACCADDFNEAYEYYTLIERPPFLYPPTGRSILMFELGAYDTCVELLSNFFQDSNFSSEPKVSDLMAKSVLITDLGLALGPLGRLDDAELLYQRALDIDLRIQSWGSVSSDYEDLAEISLFMGRINIAKVNAQSAVDFAKRASDDEEEWTSLSYLARAVFLSGDIQSSGESFRLSTGVHQRVYPEIKSLHDLWGIWYADYLRRTDRLQEAYELTNQNLNYSETEHQAEVISQCYYSLGHCFTAWGRYDEAALYYEKSLDAAQKTASIPILIESLFSQGLFFGRYSEDGIAALSDLREALGYAMKSGYRIYEADIRTAMAWAYLTLDDKDSARSDANRAWKISDDIGYYWGKVDAEEVLNKIGE